MTNPSANAGQAGALCPMAAAREVIVVLIVDDDPMVLKTLSRMLASEGLEVVAVSSSRAALSLIRDRPDVSVMVSDIDMPEVDGLELAGRLREERAEIHALEVVIITGKPTTENAVGAVRHHVFDFLGKPVRGPTIADAVRRAHIAACIRRARANQLLALEEQMRCAEQQRHQLHGLLRTSRNRLDSALRDSDRIRYEVLAVVSHELRTPLIPILGLSEILASMTECDPGTVQLYGGKIKEAGRQLLRLVDGMLELLEWDAGTPRLGLEPVAVGVLLERAVAALPVENACPPDARVHLSGPSELILRADAVRLVRALANLIDNALKASPEDAKIEVIWLRPAAGGAEIRISDRGPGISDAMIRDIGIPILQGDMSLARSWPGLGMGLAAASRVIAGHNGTLTVRRRNPGPGTEVVVTFEASAWAAATLSSDDDC